MNGYYPYQSPYSAYSPMSPMSQYSSLQQPYGLSNYNSYNSNPMSSYSSYMNPSYNSSMFSALQNPGSRMQSSVIPSVTGTSSTITTTTISDSSTASSSTPADSLHSSSVTTSTDATSATHFDGASNVMHPSLQTMDPAQLQYLQQQQLQLQQQQMKPDIVSHFNNSLQSFAQFSHVLQTGFDSFHLFLSAFLRLFESYAILRHECAGLIEGMAALNIFRYLWKRLRRIVDWVRGKRGEHYLRSAWKEASNEFIGFKPENQDWNWIGSMIMMAILWKIIRWTFGFLSKILQFNHHHPNHALPPHNPPT